MSGPMPGPMSGSTSGVTVAEDRLRFVYPAVAMHRPQEMAGLSQSGYGHTYYIYPTRELYYRQYTASVGLVLAITQMSHKEACVTAEILSLRAGAGPGGEGTARKGGLKAW